MAKKAKKPTAAPKTPPVGGRPRHTISDAEVAEARKLIGKHAYRSDIVEKLQSKFAVGKEVAYRILDKAAAEAKAELSRAGPLTPDLLAYSGLLQLATDEDASHKDRVRAWGQIVRMLQLKVPDGLGEEDAVRQFLQEVGCRQQARAQQPPPPEKPK